MSKYLLLDRVAVGGMAEVYRAKSMGVEGFEKVIAIKRILPSLAADEEFTAMFIEEAKIAGQLSHANIGAIYELGKIDGTHFIAMEYVFGKDLLAIIEQLKRMGRTPPPTMAAWIGARMLEGLDHAHRKRGVDGRPLAIIHRDVSPQNVLVSYDGMVKIIDFGIAKAASRATQTQAGVIKGKLSYMSPEQVMGYELDFRSDIFAASTCLWELLTCQRAFAGKTDIEVIDKVRTGKVARPSELGIDIGADLEAVLMRGLARDVNERWQTAGEMMEQLMRVVALSRPPFSTPRLREWMRTAFAEEMARDKEHLDRLTQVAQPGVPVAPKPAVRPAPPPTPTHEAFGGDANPFDGEDTIFSPMAAFSEAEAALAAPVPEESDVVELSQMIVVEEIFGNTAPPPPPPPNHGAATTPSVPTPGQDEFNPPTVALPDMPPAPTPILERTDPLFGDHGPPHSLAPAPQILAPHAQAPAAAPPSAVAPPVVAAGAFESKAPPAPKKKKSRAGCVIFALLLVVLGLAGAVAWLMLGGGLALVQSLLPPT